MLQIRGLVARHFARHFQRGVQKVLYWWTKFSKRISSCPVSLVWPHLVLLFAQRTSLGIAVGGDSDNVDASFPPKISTPSNFGTVYEVM
jgi:hypothetical protein